MDDLGRDPKPGEVIEVGWGKLCDNAPDEGEGGANQPTHTALTFGGVSNW